MNYRKKIGFILLIAVVLFAISAILTSPSSFGLCPPKDKFCFDPLDELIGQPLFIFSICVFIISLVLLFTREEIFRTWSKFSIVYIPVSLILIGLARSSAPNIISFDKESLTFFLATIFLIASLGIIIFKSIKLRGK